MFIKTLLGLAAAGAIALSALAASPAPAQAHTSVHIGIGTPVHYTPRHDYRRARCWLPERHLCGPTYGYGYPRPVYSYPRPVYGYPSYYHGGYVAPPAYYYQPAYPSFYFYKRW